MKVSNITNPKNGRAIPNQFLLTGVPAGTFSTEKGNLPSGDAFQSYGSMIAFRDYTGKLYLDKRYWDYSTTTSKYRRIFTGFDTAETRRLIKSGEIELVDLNG